jgi:hypothetical protein
MAITKVTEGARTLGTGEVTTANMATDPTNASNLSSGSVPTAQLGNVDTTALEDDIAILGFKVATNGSLAKYDLVDQTQDVFEDASGVDASASTNESRNASNYYSGLSETQTEFTTTGSDTWTSPAGVTSATILVVAGGGGGSRNGWGVGGAGAGGLVYVAAYTTIASTTYNLTIGAGGAGYSGAGGPGVNGQDSVFDVSGTSQILTADGGGYSGTYDPTSVGSGGSSGGTSVANGGTATQPADFGSYTGVGFGNVGGLGNANDGPGGRPAGGGGGAGSAGVAYNGSPTGQGGDGKDYSSVFGTDVGDSGWFASGGGAGTGGGRAATPGGGGDGGGTGTAGLANTGGGAGASAADNNAEAGGSGVVIVKYDQVADLTLVSNATTAEAVPTKGDIVMTYTNGVGTATINTDIKAYVSRDNGTTYTQLTLADQGDTGGHTILTAHDLDISGQPSGSAMRYKITTHNQGATKDTRIQAVSLGWS